MGLLEDSFAEREKALAGTVPSAVVIGSGAWAGQRDRLGDFLVVSVFTVSSLRLHPAIKRLDADERVMEIAQMLSSKQVTEAALMNARELMK